MNYKSYELVGDCVLCEKKAEVIYINYNILGFKLRLFCKKHAKEHQNT